MANDLAISQSHPAVNHVASDTRSSAVANPLRRIASWLILLTVLVSVLILWGGIVRLSGSGLSIPEWPIINGSLLPPFTSAGWDAVYRTYYAQIHGITDPAHAGGMDMSTFQRMFAIEYIHRFLAALVGIVFLAVFLRARKLPTVWPLVKKRLTAAGILLIVQAIFGGIVVKFDLHAAAVAIHLGTAFLFLSLLLWTAMNLSRHEWSELPERRKLRGMGWGATHTVLLQVMSGGLVAGTGAGLMLNTWPRMGSYWIPPWNLLWADWYSPAIVNVFQNQILVQFIHRWLAFVAAAAVIHLIVRMIRLPLSARGRLALRAVGSILVLQILLGIGNLLMKVPFWMAFVHLATGLTLFITLLVITHEVVYAPAAEAA
jgi:heme a synthase